MTVKPTVLPRWANVGGVVATPPSGKQDVGWISGENPPSSYFNWLGLHTYNWISYLDTLFTVGGAAQGDLVVGSGGGATGTITAAGLITASAGLTAAANQHVTLSGTGDLKHGDRVLALSPFGCVVGAGWAPDVNGYMLSSAAGALYASVPLRQGDRIKSMVFARYGDGAADFSGVDVNVISSAGGLTTIGSSGAITNPAASWADTTIDTTDTTLAAGDTAYIRFNGNAANLRVGSIRVTYDRP